MTLYMYITRKFTHLFATREIWMVIKSAKKIMQAITMCSCSRLLLFLIFPIFFDQLLFLALAQPLEHFCISTAGNFTSNSTYKSNLDHLLSSTTKINNGFYNSSFGQDPNKVNAIALCRGDTKPDTCRSCINNATQMLTQLCPNQKEAIIWYDQCMLRYSNRSIFGNMEFGPAFWAYNLNNVSDIKQFNETLETLLNNLTSRAAAGDSLRKFAAGNVTMQNGQTIYALAQCTPDLSKNQCSDCLNQAVGLIPRCCTGRQGGRVVSPSCDFRYEKDIFYDISAVTLSPSPVPQPPVPLPSSPVPPPPASVASTTGKAIKIVGAIIASVPLILLA